MLEKVQFEQSLEELSDRKLIELVARSQYEQQAMCKVHSREIEELEKRVSNVENGDRRWTAIISSSISAVIALIGAYFSRRD